MKDRLEFESEALELVYLARNNYGNAEETLNKIAKKLKLTWEQGYRYAVKTDWWREQDASMEQVGIKTSLYHGNMCACRYCFGDHK